jgi:hypothetical protein
MIRNSGAAALNSKGRTERSAKTMQLHPALPQALFSAMRSSEGGRGAHRAERLFFDSVLI